MAMTKCPECDAEISTKASACPKCGATRERSMGLLGWIVLGLFTLFVVGYVGNNVREANDEAAATDAETDWQKRLAAMPEEKRAEAQKEHDAVARMEQYVARIRSAKTVCKQFTKRTLHDPDSAQFADVSEFTAYEKPDGVYNVGVILRARNGFGALRLGRIDCVVTFDGKDWTAQSIKQHEN